MRWARGLLALAAAAAVAAPLGACGSAALPPRSEAWPASPTPDPVVADPGPPPVPPEEVAFERLTPEQRVGQLFMVGLSSGDGGPEALAGAILTRHAGSVVLYGSGWDGAARVSAATAALQAMATPAATGAIRLWVAANQEGGVHGSFQALYGDGFDDIPSATVQGGSDPSALEARAASWGRQLVAAGVNNDLAPVADTVPAGNGPSNAAIGLYGRQFGSDPADVASHASAFIHGLAAAGVTATAKHFPGLGRVAGNTDFAASVSDGVTARGDPYLSPFQAAIGAGAQMVMVSLATYTQIDPQNPAAFSPAVVGRLLRDDLGFDGVVVSDDLGAAASVQAVPPGERALRFLQAGGDLILTVRPADLAPMSDAILAKMQSDADFSRTVDLAVRRVLRAKVRAGLAPA